MEALQRFVIEQIVAPDLHPDSLASQGHSEVARWSPVLVHSKEDGCPHLAVVRQDRLVDAVSGAVEDSPDHLETCAKQVLTVPTKMADQALGC